MRFDEFANSDDKLEILRLIDFAIWDSFDELNAKEAEEEDNALDDAETSVLPNTANSAAGPLPAPIPTAKPASIPLPIPPIKPAQIAQAKKLAPMKIPVPSKLTSKSVPKSNLAKTTKSNANNSKVSKTLSKNAFDAQNAFDDSNSKMIDLKTGRHS
jgi:hypothetical protein